MEDFNLSADRFSSPPMVNLEIRLNFDLAASKAGFQLGNKTFCCGSRFCMQLCRGCPF